MIKPIVRAASAALLLLLASVPASANPRPNTAPLTAGIGGPFNLIDQNGRPVTERNLLGRPTVIFFGFTYCPEVCPTTLTRLSQHLRALGRDADRLNVVFVSVDTERDTPAQLKEYLSAFDPRIQGFTGSPREIARIASEYRVYYRKVRLPGGAFSYDHSATVYLMDARGQFVEPIGYGESDAMAMASLRRLINR